MRAILFAFAIGACSVIVVPHAASASTTQTFHLSSQGGDAYFQTISGCVETDTFVTAAQSMSQGTTGGPPPQPGVLVGIFQGNNCTQTVLMRAFGTAAPTTLQMSRMLSTGAVTATVPMLDYVTNNAFTVAVNITWTGTGPVSRSVSTNHFQSSGFSVTEHFNGSSRQATAGGSVFDGVTEWAGPAASFADLFAVNNGSVAITRP